MSIYFRKNAILLLIQQQKNQFFYKKKSHYGSSSSSSSMAKRKSKDSHYRIKSNNNNNSHFKTSSADLILPQHLEERISNWRRLLIKEQKAIQKEDTIKKVNLRSLILRFKSLSFETMGLTLKLESIAPISTNFGAILDAELKRRTPILLTYYYFNNNKENNKNIISSTKQPPTTTKISNENLSMEISEQDLIDIEAKNESVKTAAESVETAATESVSDDVDMDEKSTETYFLNRTGRIFSFSVLDDFKLTLTEKLDYEFKMNIIRGDFVIEKLIDKIQARKEWSKLPGYKLMLYAYRARTMPTVLNDKNITLSKDFNKEQCEAIKAALNPKRPLITIQGPPGTGKTKVIAEIIMRSIEAKKKVICCAASHKAVQNLMEHCAKRGIGKYCNLSRFENEYTVEGQLEKHSYFSLLKNDLSRLNSSNWEIDSIEYKDGLNKANKLRYLMKETIAQNNPIIFTTLFSSTTNHLIRNGFEPDLVIMDEGGQVIECSSWPILFQASRAVIVGDHKQLAGNIVSEEGKANNLESSLLEYLCNEFPKNVNFFLKIQYRSNKLIQEWSNQEFYENKLIADSTVENICLRDLIEKNRREIYGDYDDTIDSFNKDEAEKDDGIFIEDPLVLVDTDLYTKNAKLFQERFSSNKSYSNKGEAQICAYHLSQLMKKDRLKISQVGCITPYSAQTADIKNCLKDDIKQVDISSVDAFQGQQREAIVMSFVRNNATKNLGFLSDYRRLNVAITRAKRQFFLVASSKMLRSDPVLNRLYEVFKAKGKIISPEIYLIQPKRESKKKKN